MVPLNCLGIAVLKPQCRLQPITRGIRILKMVAHFVFLLNINSLAFLLARLHARSIWYLDLSFDKPIQK